MDMNDKEVHFSFYIFLLFDFFFFLLSACIIKMTNKEIAKTKKMLSTGSACEPFVSACFYPG